MTAVIGILLGLSVLCAWLANVGFLRFNSALDRLHSASFVNAAGGLTVTIAAIIHDGMSDRSLKIIAAFAILLLAGAALTHAAGRALVLRDGAGR